MKPANLLMIRELNVNGCGDFADVLFQLEHPLSSEENRALRVELTRLKQVMDDPDTDTVTRLAVHNIFGPSGAWNGYELIEF